MYSGSSGGGYYESRSSSYGRDSYSDRHRTSSGFQGSSSSYDRYRNPSRSSHRSSSPSTRELDNSRHRHHRSPSPGPSHRRSENQRRYDSPAPARHDRQRARERHSSPFSNRKDSEERRRPAVEDNRNVLERMEKSFSDGPLEVFKRCMKDKTKIKIWTRNFKEVRGICTGFVLAFDKHWNLIMRDVDEIYLRPRKGKNPFLRELKSGDADLIPEMKIKVPKEKKDFVKENNAMECISPENTDESSEKIPAQVENSPDIIMKKEKQKEKRKKKKAPLMCKRHVGQLFIRGDNVVMAAVIVENSDAPSSPKNSELGDNEEDSQE